MEIDAERLSHLPWSGYRDQTHLLLASVVSMCGGLVFLNGPAVEAKARRFVELCKTLRTIATPSSTTVGAED